MGNLSVSASTTINAPTDVVFNILADPRQHQRIDGSGTVRALASGPDRLSDGARFAMGMKMGAPYRMSNRVVEFEEGRLIAWRHVGPHRWRYELAPVPAGTQVTETWDASYYGRLGQACLKAVRLPARTQRGIDQTLVRLKEAAEADVSATP